MQGAKVQFLVRELRFHMPHIQRKQTNKKKEWGIKKKNLYFHLSKGHCQEKLTTKLIKSSCLFRSGAGWGVQRQGILAFNFKCLVLFYFLNMSTHCSSKNAHTHIHTPPTHTHTHTHMTLALVLSDAKWSSDVGRVWNTICRLGIVHNRPISTQRQMC